MQMNLPGPDVADRIWLDGLARSIKVFGRWKKLLLRCALDDAYYRGYNRGLDNVRKGREHD